MELLTNENIAIGIGCIVVGILLAFVHNTTLKLLSLHDEDPEEIEDVFSEDPEIESFDVFIEFTDNESNNKNK